MDPPELICRETGVVRPRPVRPVPKDSCRLPVFSSVSGWRTRPVRGCTASRPACRGCLRFGPARFDAMCLRMRSAQSGPALRAARRFCRRAHGLCAPYVHLRPRRSLPRPALASFAPCASVTAPSAPGPLTLVPRPGPRVLRVLRVCGCTVRARPVHPRAAARACACPAPACRGPAHAVRPFMCRFFRPHFCRLPSPSLGLVLAAAASCPCVRSCRPNCGLFLVRKNLPPRPACGPAQQEAGEGAHASVPGAFHARNNIRCKRLGHVYAAGAIRRKW